MPAYYPQIDLPPPAADVFVVNTKPTAASGSRTAFLTEPRSTGPLPDEPGVVWGRKHLERAQARFDSLSEIRDGWLGEGTRAPSPESMRVARNLVVQMIQIAMLPKPGIFPTPEGGVRAEWVIGSWAVDVEVSDSEVQVLATNAETREEYTAALPSGSFRPDWLGAWISKVARVERT